MQKIRANEIEFSYLSYGEGPLLLCLHGFPDSAYTWDALGPRFAEMGYHVVAPFMRIGRPIRLGATASSSRQTWPLPGLRLRLDWQYQRRVS